MSADDALATDVVRLREVAIEARTIVALAAQVGGSEWDLSGLPEEVVAYIDALDPATCVALLDRLATAEAKVAAVQRIADPLGSYMPYAVALDDDVILAVAVDDLRAVIADEPRKPPGSPVDEARR